MKITIIQSKLFWEQLEKNLRHFEKTILAINEKTDLIVLPEMFTSGFTMNRNLIAEAEGTITLPWMKKMAKKKKCCITGSVAVKSGKHFYNRLYFVHPNGKYSFYDKRHLFRMANEDRHYTHGSKKTIETVKGWKILPLICYDLRFPVWSRNVFTKTSNNQAKGKWQYDVLIYVANWPKARNYPWKQLLIARAIENQCYVVGVNRIGRDGNGIEYSGDSMIIDPKGIVVSKIKAGRETTETVKLDQRLLEDFRSKFPVGQDADAFKIT